MAAWSRCDRRFVRAAGDLADCRAGLVGYDGAGGARGVGRGGFRRGWGISLRALESGKAYCWGSDTYGELGDGVACGASPHPVAVYSGGVLAGKTLTRITVGYDDTCALDSGGAAIAGAGTTRANSATAAPPNPACQWRSILPGS